MTVDELRRATDLLLNQVNHWTPARWQAHADTVRALLQDLADRVADRTGSPRRQVPRLHDLALPDQLRVIVSYLIESKPDLPELDLATSEIIAVRRALQPR